MNRGNSSFFDARILLYILIILFVVGCRREKPQTIVLTPMATATTTIDDVAVDPTIAAVLAQVTTTPVQETVTPVPTQSSETTCSFPENWVVYTVQPNDTLFAIANALDITVADIKSANCKLDDALAVGETLYLPQLPPITQFSTTNPEIILPGSTNEETSESINGNLHEENDGAVSTNAVFSLNAENQILPGELIKEIGYFGGGGGGGCGHLASDNEVLAHVVALKSSHSLIVCIGWPASLDISVKVSTPLDEEFSLEVYESHVGNNAQAVYDIPLNAPNGKYYVSVGNLPEEGRSIEKLAYVNPALRREELENGFVVTLSQFEPHEFVQLLAYQTPKQNSVARLIAAQSYQVNSEGYQLIEIDESQKDLMFAAIGEQSGFISEHWIGYQLTLVNNNSREICEIWMNQAGRPEPEHKESFFYPIEPGQTKLANALLELNIYNFKAWDCSGNLVGSIDNFEIGLSNIWEIP